MKMIFINHRIVRSYMVFSPLLQRIKWSLLLPAERGWAVRNQAGHPCHNRLCWNERKRQNLAIRIFLWNKGRRENRASGSEFLFCGCFMPRLKFFTSGIGKVRDFLLKLHICSYTRTGSRVIRESNQWRNTMIWRIWVLATLRFALGIGSRCSRMHTVKEIIQRR